eukprot:CAMPEP_0194325574 /NCGR_PEP_ID=MMETSP0171-20130528/31512_1 /TAXON_ID=218684 /ORGANISM="Corethron pennatum, Strain L29A3" /LENGTH=117 /DNA_ID=CAMNT_0039084769 /DNA_START=350 /DNA_END=699 /DNA_ORIENTATION=-
MTHRAHITSLPVPLALHGAPRRLPKNHRQQVLLHQIRERPHERDEQPHRLRDGEAAPDPRRAAANGFMQWAAWPEDERQRERDAAGAAPVQQDAANAGISQFGRGDPDAVFARRALS